MDITFHFDPALIEQLFKITMWFLLILIAKKSKFEKRKGKRKASSRTRSFSKKDSH